MPFLCEALYLAISLLRNNATTSTGFLRKERYFITSALGPTPGASTTLMTKHQGVLGVTEQDQTWAPRPPPQIIIIH